VTRRNAIVGGTLLSLTLLILLSAASAASVQAASPAWRLLAVTGPTNLPPVTSEVQEVAVDAEGGTFTLSFESETTAPLNFDASPAEVAAALNGLSSIGGAGGSVEVSGGPGGPGGTDPYFVRFAGSLGGDDVAEMTADSSQLTGGAASATVSTKTDGGAPGKGILAVYPTNVGGAATNGTPVTLTIGPLPPGISTAGSATGNGWTCLPAGAGHSLVTCTRNGAVDRLGNAPVVQVPLAVSSAAAETSSLPVSIEGGGAPLETYETAIVVSAGHAEPGIQAFWAGAFDENGQPEDQAGDHPYSAGTFFIVNTFLPPSGSLSPAGDLKDVLVDLPPGFVGNPMVTNERCPQNQLAPPTDATVPVECDADSIVGHAGPITQTFPLTPTRDPIYNNVPAAGYPAQFTFPVIFAKLSAFASLRSDEDYGVRVTAPNVPPVYKAFGANFMLEGEPAAAAGKAFLTNPSNCAEQALTMPLTTIRANAWHIPTLFDEFTVEIPPVTECHKLKFEPKFSFQPSSAQAATVTAATADLSIPQDGLLDPDKLAPPHLKKSVVTLPVGLTLNPSAADGLQACSTQQIGLRGTNFPAPNPIRFDKSSPACPDGSKIGTAVIDTPLLEDPLQGTVFLAAQDDNPFRSLLAMYISIDDAKTGTVVKLPGEVTPDPQTGQLTAVFDNNPQLPFSNLRLHFRGGGPRSTMATPDVCGTYTTNGEWTPWSAPESGPPATTADAFTVSGGPGGSACAQTKAQRPFSLGFAAGGTNPKAGAHSPFRLRITRPDGNQELDRITVKTPPGFAATLKGVAICSDSAVAAAGAASRTGSQELANPSCPASSQVGTTTIGAGVGSSPLYVKTGKVYLSGPYKGAPVSLSFVVPAVAGPFDLGVQVVRTALRVDPRTAQVTAESDPIPQILKGIPLLIRDVIVDLDRPNFTLNPTSCEVMSINGTVSGGSGAVATLANRFQVGACKNLGFKPRLKLRLHGKTHRAAYQRLVATVRARPGDANISRAAVTLPPSSFLAQEHIRTVCTRVQFAADACPKGSIYGYAEATTPLLDGKLQGPVYLRSSDNLLPDLVAALRGPEAQPIEVELAGRTDSKNRGLRNTFDIVPDAPVSKFTLRLKGGKKSLIVNSRDLCKGKQRATVRLNAHNGMKRNYRTVVKNDCGKKKAKKAKGHGKRRGA
jgi:hypothetical protein